jgi:3-dehydroquinate synthase
MLDIPVELGARRYVISVGHGLARRLPDLLAPLGARRTVAVASRRVFETHGKALARALDGLRTVKTCLVPDGERFKTRRTLDTVYDAFLDARLGRDGLVVALGGGVVGDLAGFAAASWMRGVDWVVVPTTLLAMVDSSIGGKVGINHPKVKNLIGAFHQPRAVVSDPALLETLPPRELRSGAYEILKCGVIADRALVRAVGRAPSGLTGWSRIDLENAVASACRIKAEVVERDEREAGLRRVLNLGHTLGHGLEAATGFKRFTHGEAVGWGLIGAAWIARRRELLAESSFDAIAAAVDRVGPRPRVSDLSPERILKAVSHDKKAQRGRATFVLPVALGRVVIRPDVEPAEIRRALKVMSSREARLS